MAVDDSEASGSEHPGRPPRHRRIRSDSLPSRRWGPADETSGSTERGPGATTIAAIILAVGLIVAFVGELASDDWGWRWGSAGDWVGGIDGILAFAAALGIALVEHQRFTNERERREASEQELRDRELRLSAAAIIVRRAGGSSGSQGTKFGLAIENMSDSFISDVELTAYYSEDRFPNVESDDRHDSDTRPILRPHPAGGYQWNHEFRGPPGVVGREQPVFRARWIDADGGRWQTDPEGEVFRIPIDADDDLWHDPALIGESDRHTPLRHSTGWRTEPISLSPRRPSR